MLRVHIKRNAGKTREPAQQLLEVVTPRTNTALISPAEHLCASLTLQTRGPGGGPVALEIVADGERSRFLVRTESNLKQRQLQGQVGAAYPQAALRSLELAILPMGDPVQIGPHEQMASYTLGLRSGDHLPIRTFQDRDLDADAGAGQTDPVLGILGAMDGLPVGWRALCQVVLLEPAPANWARGYQSLALENPIQAERSGRNDAGSSLTSVISILGLGFAALVGLNAWAHGSAATGGRSRLLPEG